MLKIDYANLEFIDKTLRKIVLAAHEEFPEAEVVTSLYRMEGAGVHTTLPLRGTDLRCWDDDLGARVQTWVNEKYQYDPKRPWLKCCMYHQNRSGGGKHLHFQSHPNTVKV